MKTVARQFGGLSASALTAAFALLLIAPALSVSANPTQAAQPQEKTRQERFRLARQQLDRGNRLKTGLNTVPENARIEKDYLGAVRAFRRVYDIAPFSGLAADGLAESAALYHDMGKLFGRGYYKKSIETYRFLLQEYPRSQYRGTALYQIAQIQHIHLKQDSLAVKTYREFLRKYPDSKSAAEARKSLKAAESALAAVRARRKSRSRATPVAIQKPAAPQVKPTKERTEIRNIRFWNAKGYTRVVLDLAGEVHYQGARVTGPDRIFFDLFNTRLGPELTGKEFAVNEGLLNRIRIAENRSGVTRVVLEVNGAEDYSVFTLPKPYRLVVDIRSSAGRDKPASEVASSKPATSSKKPETASVPPQPPLTSGCGQAYDPKAPRPASTGNHTLSRALGLKVNRIVLDPGHGGSDRGTRGPAGLKEKDLVLDIAKRLAKRLEKELCAEVILTRKDDRFIPLENRAPLANQKQADLFISIHANYSPNRRVRGVETYYLNFTSDPAALEVAARENALSQQSVHDLQDIIKKISRHENISESRELAAHVQNGMADRLRRYSKYIRNRGVQKAPFVVLIGANMPAVLAEVSFISNRSDETHLKSSRGRDRVVEGLFNGISAYLKDINGLVVAQATD